MKKKLVALSFLLVVPLFLGCGNSRLPGLVPAAGVITLNGEPIEGVTISFVPLSTSGDARTATAVSGTGGKFAMSTLDPNDGILPGNYRVSVSKKTGIGGDTSAFSNERAVVQDSRQTINHLPAKYSSGSATDLSVSIPPKGDKNIEIKLEGEVDLTPQSPGPRR